MQWREKAAGAALPHHHAAVRLDCAELAGDGPEAAFAAADAAAGAAGDAAALGARLPLWADAVTGALLPEEPPPLRDFGGGLFADEPGLGKTITAVGLGCLLRLLLRLRLRRLRRRLLLLLRAAAVAAAAAAGCSCVEQHAVS